MTVQGILVALQRFRISHLAGAWIAVSAVVWGTRVTGWASLIVSVFVGGGVQIFITGMVGIYMDKSFEEAKKQPLCFVKNTSNLERSRL